MELKELINLSFKKKTEILCWGLVGGLVALVLHILPPSYYATGALFVKREVNENTNHFTYEGYYAQQTAIAYTNTVAALLETDDVQSNALKKYGITVDEKTLHRYSKNIRIKKVAPQLISITVKGNRSEGVLGLWSALTAAVEESSQKINLQGDNKLGLSLVSESPVIKKAYKSLWIYIPAGIISGLCMGLFLVTFKKYA